MGVTNQRPIMKCSVFLLMMAVLVGEAIAKHYLIQTKGKHYLVQTKTSKPKEYKHSFLESEDHPDSYKHYNKKIGYDYMNERRPTEATPEGDNSATPEGDILKIPSESADDTSLLNEPPLEHHNRLTDSKTGSEGDDTIHSLLNEPPLEHHNRLTESKTGSDKYYIGDDTVLPPLEHHNRLTDSKLSEHADTGLTEDQLRALLNLPPLDHHSMDEEHDEVHDEVQDEVHDKGHIEEHDEKHDEGHDEAHDEEHDKGHDEGHDEAHDKAHDKEHDKGHVEGHDEVHDEGHDEVHDEVPDEGHDEGHGEVNEKDGSGDDEVKTDNGDEGSGEHGDEPPLEAESDNKEKLDETKPKDDKIESDNK